jgi:hypothetical protein
MILYCRLCGLEIWQRQGGPNTDKCFEKYIVRECDFFIDVLTEESRTRVIIYIDEIGTHDPSGLQRCSDVIAVVGYAAPLDAWESIERTWMQTLDLYGVTQFQTHSLVMKQESPEMDWPELKRQQFINALIEIVRSHTSLGVAGVLNVRDYEEFAPDWFQRESEHPYYFGFQLFFDMLLGTLEKLLDPPLLPQQKLTFVLDQNDFMQRSAGTFLQLKALRDTHDRMGTITFKSRKDCPLLQVVDLIACLMRDDVARQTQSKPKQQWAAEMRQRYNLVSGIYDRDNIPGLIQRIMAAKLKAASTNSAREMRVVV